MAIKKDTQGSKTKEKKPTYTTPKGELLFAHIVEVDYGTEDYPCEEGRYCCTLVLPKKDAKVLLARLEDEIASAKEFAEEAFEELKPATKKKFGEMRFNEICEDEYDEDENPTGRVKLRFRTSAFLKKKDGTKVKRKVPIFDTLAQPVKLTEELGNGSIAKIAFTTAPYFVDGTGVGGLALYLNAIQLLKLVTYGERSAEDYGFEAEDNDEYGFTADDVSPSNDTDDAGDDATEGDNEEQEAPKSSKKGHASKSKMKPSEDVNGDF